MADVGNVKSYAVARVAGDLMSPANRRARLTVFCYHQVLTGFDNLRPGEPDEQQFLNDIRLIDRVFNVLPFGEAVKRLESGSLPGRAASITFDDGYANNHELAAPILLSAGVPATFFIAGGAIDRGVMWNDLVIESVASAGSASQATKLSATLAELKYRPMAERWGAAERMYRNAIGPDLPRLMMTREMVADLANRGFEIGGHTLNHPILAALPDDAARSEIEGCAAWIHDVTGQTPKSFAYPNGVPGRDYQPKHAVMARDAGFEAAASTEWSVARPGTNSLNIPRVGPWWRQGRTLTAGLCRGYLKSYIAR